MKKALTGRSMKGLQLPPEVSNEYSGECHDHPSTVGKNPGPILVSAPIP